jgi:hypothetical protein
MVIHETLFEIAIYRIDQESWSRTAQERIEISVQATLDSWSRSGIEPDADARKRAERMARFAERPVEWEYNEIISWVRLVWDGPGPVIKGYAWQVGHSGYDGSFAPRKRYQRGFKPHPFVGGDPFMKVIENWFNDDLSNHEIYDRLRGSLIELVALKGGDFPGRFIDLQSFDTLGPYIDWRTLIRLNR